MRLGEGAKTDKIDAEKLVHLLRSGLLKKVFHSGDDFIYLRKIVSGYEDVVKSGVRVKNQRSALFRASHENSKKQTELKRAEDNFVLSGLDRSIISYEEEKKRYETEFKRLLKKHKEIRFLKNIPGIGVINAVKVARNAVSRRIATLTLGVLKSGGKFKPCRERKDVNNKKTVS